MVYSPLLLLALALIAWLPQNLFAQTNEPRDLFAKGYQLYSTGKLTQAKEPLQKTVDAGYRLADYSLYYLARIALDENNGDQTRQYVAQLRRGFPHSVWFHATTLLRVKIDVAEKKFAQASESLRQLRADKSVPPEIADEAHFLQGQMHEAQGDVNRAFTLYRELRIGSPGSRWAASARKEQTRLRTKFPEQFTLSTIEAQADEADRLARERQTHDAEELYKKVLAGVTEPVERLRFLVKLASLYLSTGGRNEAIPTLEQIARDYPDSAEAPKALYQIGQTYWNRHENARAFEYFKNVLEKYPASGYVDRAQYASADIHEYFGRKEEAMELYSNVQKQFPKSQVRDDAAWRLAWLYYRSGELQKAQESFRALATQSKNSPYATASLYWQARIAEKLSDVESAKQLLRKIVHSGEESYYQALSLRGLERLGATLDESKLAQPASNNEPDPTVDAEVSFHLSRARELGAISLHSLAVAELDEISRRAKGKNRLQPLLMREYFLNVRWEGLYWYGWISSSPRNAPRDSAMRASRAISRGRNSGAAYEVRSTA